MSDVLQARKAYRAAREEVTRTRLALGQAIREARSAGVQQVEISKKLDLTREQVRRYQAEYEKHAGLAPSS